MAISSFTNDSTSKITHIFQIVVLIAFLNVIGSEANAVPLKPDAYWNFDDGTAKDSTNRRLHGKLIGEPDPQKGLTGNAFKFNGIGQGVKLPDSRGINTGGPFRNRTVGALFYCDRVNQNQKQVIFEAGGVTKGLVIYVYKSRVYVGAWNIPNYNWDGSYLFADIKSRQWYYVVLVIRNATNSVQSEKFEMWLDGQLIGKAKGAQLQAHGQDMGIAHVSQHTKYHDDGGRGRDVDWFGGLIDEVVIYNSALNTGNLLKLMNPLNVEPIDKITTTWGNLKMQRQH